MQILEIPQKSLQEDKTF